MVTPYETYNGQIGVRLSFLVSDSDLKHDRSIGVIGYEAYKWRAKKHDGFKLRTAHGKGNEVLINWKYISLREDRWKDVLIKEFGSPEVDRNPLERHFTMDEAARSKFLEYVCGDGSKLKPHEVDQCVTNISVLQAFVRMKLWREQEHRRKGNSSRGLWPGLLYDLEKFNDTLKTFYGGLQHTLPKSERRIRADISGMEKEGYEYFIDARKRNKSAAKIKDSRAAALLETLLRKNANFNNEQIAELYNSAAEVLGFDAISASTVANKRKELGFYIVSGNRGTMAFEGKYAMQNKRSAPTVSMAYWSMDGWLAELLYQKETIDKKGHTVITYHNRLTVVIVLDPVAGIKYPIGYAIGTHETPALITEALRNAANHTKELFGRRYKPLQLQSDNYAIKTLTPIYEAMSEYFTPARVRNPKAKVVEPYHAHISRKAQVYYPENFSGHNKTARAENQPNSEYLDKVKKNFPDEEGCRKQIERLMQMERDEKINDYLKRWDMLAEEDRLPLHNSEYLLLFGKSHTHTNRLQGQGLTPTIEGQSLCFDTFDFKFRELAYKDWMVKYDPDNLDEILVLDAKTDANRNVVEVIGSHQFLLQQKYIQPMAIYDQKPGDQKKLAEVSRFNKELVQKVIAASDENQLLVNSIFEEYEELNDTLVKHVLTDSNGQHKDQKTKQRLGAAKVAEIGTGEDYEIIEDEINY
jgi:hypothetical protein